MGTHEEQQEIKSQSVTVVTLFVITEASKAIVGFVALYFFKPIWQRIVNRWEKKN